MVRLDPTVYDPASHTYTLLPSQGTRVGSNVKMLQAFHLDPNSTNTSIKVTSTSTALDYEADLTSAPPVPVPANLPSLDVNWAGMKTTAHGAEFERRSIQEVVILHFDTLTPAELEPQLPHLEQLATDTFRADVLAGEELNTSELNTGDGVPFQGVTSAGTWLLALRCTGCSNPAPWYMAKLHACD